MLYPTTVDVLGDQDRLTLCWTVEAPVPVTGSATVGLDASLENATLAEVVPLDWGEKVTLKGTLWPAEIVKGSFSPLRMNSELFEEPDDMVTLAPLAVSVPAWVWLVPTVIVPKFMLPGVTASCPGLVAVPASGTLRFASDASETKDRVPLVDPATSGEKTTLSVRL
jgi:hypothetical protein